VHLWSKSAISAPGNSHDRYLSLRSGLSEKGRTQGFYMNHDITETQDEYIHPWHQCVACGQDRRKLTGALRGSSQTKKKRAIELVLACPVCRGVLYTTYRKVTRHCETCGAALHNHPKCYRCYILLGKDHESEGIPVDPEVPGKLWCGFCHAQDKASARRDRGIDFREEAKFFSPYFTGKTLAGRRRRM